MTATRKPRRAGGQVALVGAGAGDPGLLPLRAAELLADAELVLADAALPDDVLRGVPEGAEVLRTQADDPVTAQLVAAAKEVRRVVRVLPGDPLTSEGGLREADAVLKGKQRLEVVPGIPAHVAVPTYAGVPLGMPHTVAAHPAPGGGDADWRALAPAPGSLALHVAIADVPKAAAALVEHGRRSDTAVAVVVGGTTQQQRTVLSTLDGVEQDVATAGVQGDAVLVVGDAARRGGRLGWYESRALYGWRVLVPRTRDQAGALSQQLRGYGAIPV